MNARQKAKRFKKLYEESLPKKPYPVVYENIDSFTHFRIKQCIAFDDVVYHAQGSKEKIKRFIENKVLEELRPLIFDRLVVTKDLYTEGYFYSLDLYLRRNIDEFISELKENKDEYDK